MNLKGLVVGVALATAVGVSAQAGTSLSGTVTYYNDYVEAPATGITFGNAFQTDSFTAISDTVDYGGTNSDPLWPGGAYSPPSGDGLNNVTPGYGFGADFNGDINVAAAGTYTFLFGADDAAYLFANGAPVTSIQGGNDFCCSGAPTPVTLTLSAGPNPFEIQYANEFANQSALVFEAAPEPAAWAMMLFGLGVVGAGLRLTRRRTVPASASA